MIPHNRPQIAEEDIAAVAATLASGWIAQGREVRAFEEEMAEFLGAAGDAVAVSSCTAALHLTLLALGVGPGDEVILPTYVCTAVLNAIYHAGATPVLADIRPEDFNLCPEQARKKLSPRTKAIIAPHMYGFPADIAALRTLGVPVIEDCAQAIGASVSGQKVGTLGDAAVFSFYATKLMTTGQGGMIVGPRDLVEAARDLRDFDCRPTYRVRYNYQMTDFQAALGRSQLRRLPEFLARRAELAARYRRALPEGWRMQRVPSNPGIENPRLGSVPPSVLPNALPLPARGFRNALAAPPLSEAERGESLFAFGVSAQADTGPSGHTATEFIPSATTRKSIPSAIAAEFNPSRAPSAITAELIPSSDRSVVTGVPSAIAPPPSAVAAEAIPLDVLLEPVYYRCVVLPEGEDAVFPDSERDPVAHFAARGIRVIRPTDTWELLHRYLHRDPQDFPVAESVAARAVSLPVFPALTDAEATRIADALAELAA